MHDDHFILVRRYQTTAGRVASRPILLLADVEQYGIHALLSGRAGIEVIGEHFVAVIQTVVHDDLFTLEVGMAERGRNVDDRTRLIALALLSVDKALQMRQCEREERALHRADQHRAITVNIAARVERHQDQFLCFEPRHRLAAQVGKGIAVHVGKALLVGRLIIRDAHRVRIAAAHVILGKVNRRTILAADDICFLVRALTRHIKDDVVHIGMLRTEHHVVQLGLGRRDVHALAMLDHVKQLIRKSEFVEQRVHLFVSSFHTVRALPHYRTVRLPALSSYS